MKLITVIIKPYTLDDAREPLGPIGVQGITLSEGDSLGLASGVGNWSRIPDVEVVPEPSSVLVWMLLLGGGAAVVAWRSKRTPALELSGC